MHNILYLTSIEYGTRHLNMGSYVGYMDHERGRGRAVLVIWMWTWTGTLAITAL